MRNTHGRKVARPLVSSGVTLCLLSGVAIDRALFHLPGLDSTAYHARVRAAQPLIPYDIGPWMGEDMETPAAAVALLKPNLIEARRYTNLDTHRTVTFLLVHCRDARDLIGHYPPVCYPNAGWVLERAEPCDWRVGDLTVHGTRYDFESKRLGGAARAGVDNFMLLPDGTTCAGMDGVYDVAADPGKKFYGAAQVQLVSDGSMTREERDEMVRLFVAANRPIFDRIRGGIAP